MDIIGLVLVISAVMLSLTVHEVAHGWTAERFGDPTAREQGRITLNPLKHIDPIFTIVVPAVLYLTAGILFGGAKPVPFDPRRFKPGTNIKTAIMWVAAAGPISNFILAFLAQLLMQLSMNAFGAGISGNISYQFLNNMFILNIVLGIFNLVPIPPLDGAKVLAGLLPDAMAMVLYRMERYALFFFIGLVLLLNWGNGMAYLLKPIEWTALTYEQLVRAII